MANALATSSLEYQKFAMYLKNYKLGDSLLGDVQKLETTFYDISNGFANIPANIANAFNQVGLNIMDYNGTFESTMKLFDDLQEKTKGMSKDKRNFILRQLGISSDLGYLWDKGGRASDYYTITDEAIRKNQELAESMGGLDSTIKNLKEEFISKISPSLKTIVDSLDSWLKIFGQNGGVEKTTHVLGSGVKESISKNHLDNILNATTPLYRLGKFTYGLYNGYKGINLQELETINNPDKTPNSKATPNNKPPKNLPTGMAADITPESLEGTGIPTNFTNASQNNTNNITQNIQITGNNATEIAHEVARVTKQDIQYTQYQATNLPGL
jgi:hypothetical protein